MEIFDDADIPSRRIIDFIPGGWCSDYVTIQNQKNYVLAYNYLEYELGSWSLNRWRSYRSAWSIIFRYSDDALRFKLMGF